MSNDEVELIKLSASSVKLYDQCPRKYFYQYIKRAPKKHWSHLDLGNLCHRALEIFHLVYMKHGLNKGSLSKIMKFAFKEARKKYPNMSDNILLDAKEMLMGYLKMVRSEGMPVVKGVETSFNLDISDDVLVRGYIDRLDIMKDGTFRIVDYKTTKNETYLDEFQLLVYGMWLSKEYPHVKKFKGSYVLLRHGSAYKNYDFTIEDVEKVKQKLLDCANNIKNDEEWVQIPTRLCDWCDFKDICPAQKAW